MVVEILVYTIYIVLLVIIFKKIFWFLSSSLPLIFKGAPYVDSSDEKIKTMIETANIKKKDKVVDLGSGDGRVVFAAAEKCDNVMGIEINPSLVKKSVKETPKQISKKVHFEKGNFMKMDLSNFDVVFIYGIGYLMKDLEKKLLKELKPGAKVISNYFQFPKWKPVKEKNDVYLYKKT